MQKLSYIKCSPGGNITVLVFTEMERARQPDIAKQIMAIQPDVEQVGYVEKPNDSRAIARLQMMGGEFCGNATRSLAWVLKKKAWPETNQADGVIPLEVSGAERVLQVQISDRVVKVEMPIKRELNSVKKIGDKTIVALTGISHVLVNQSPPPNTKDEADRLLNELGLKNLEAAGVLYCQPYKDGIFMTPIVWVRDTNTLIEETACASGTVCIALAHAAASGEHRTDLCVYQPSGGVIIASVERDNNTFSQAFIEGPVEILEDGEIVVSG